MSAKSLKAYSVSDVIQDYCQPLVAVIGNEFKQIHCNQCMNGSEGLMRCGKCVQMYYCSKDCQTIDWRNGHKNECKLMAKQSFKRTESSTIERLLLRLWLWINCDKSFATKRHKLFDGSDVCLNDIEVNVKAFEKDMSRVFEFREICSHFTSYGLKFETKELFHWFAFISLAPILNTLLYHSSDDFLRSDVGFGVFIETSTLKHSCNPNAAVVNNGLSLQVRAMKSIAAEEEIRICFMDLCKDKSERQEIMKKWFYSECNCDKCEGNVDSGVNYQNFLSLLHYVYSISHLGDVLGKEYISRIDSTEANHKMNEIMSLYNVIYGEYNPTLTAIQIQHLLALIMLWKGKKADKESVRLFHKHFEQNIVITHGSTHQYFQLFTKIADKYPFLKDL